MELLTRTFYEAIERERRGSSISDAELSRTFKDAVPEVVRDFASKIKESLLSDAPRMLQDRRTEFTQFSERNQHRWGAAFDLLETLVVICTEAGHDINASYRPQAVEQNDLVFDVVVRHHARACQIACEITSLLRAGFSDGAHARWRALHEATVTGIFVKDHGSECAERFIWHDVIESYKAMREHKKFEGRLRERGPTGIELAEAKRQYDELIAKYGRNFERPYGWASYVFDDKRVSFAHIEANASLDHMRPYYRWASYNVHAGAKGIFRRLGVPMDEEEVLLVGPSDAGMTDPGHACAISLVQITVALLCIDPNIDRLVILRIAQDLVEDVGEAFMRCGAEAGS